MAGFSFTDLLNGATANTESGASQRSQTLLDDLAAAGRSVIDRVADAGLEALTTAIRGTSLGQQVEQRARTQAMTDFFRNPMILVGAVLIGGVTVLALARR